MLFDNYIYPTDLFYLIISYIDPSDLEILLIAKQTKYEPDIAYMPLFKSCFLDHKEWFIKVLFGLIPYSKELCNIIENEICRKFNYEYEFKIRVVGNTFQNLTYDEILFLVNWNSDSYNMATGVYKWGFLNILIVQSIF